MIKPPPRVAELRDIHDKLIKGALEIEAARFMRDSAGSSDLMTAISGDKVELEESAREWTAGRYFYGSAH